MGKKIIAPESKHHGMNIEEIEKNSDVMSTGHRKALNRAELRQKFVSPPSQYAQSNLFFTNYLYKDAHKLYPNAQKADYRFVDKCYPYAKGGMLLVDEPRTPQALKRAKETHVHLKKMGFRHVIYEDEMDVYDLAKQEEDSHGLANGDQGSKNQAQ